jgi:hypothetical protein
MSPDGRFLIAAAHSVAVDERNKGRVYISEGESITFFNLIGCRSRAAAASFNVQQKDQLTASIKVLPAQSPDRMVRWLLPYCNSIVATSCKQHHVIVGIMGIKMRPVHACVTKKHCALQ